MAETIRVCDCPKDVEVLLDPNSYAMKYIKKRSGFTNIITNGRIVCPAVRKKVNLLVAAKSAEDIQLFCRELMDETCPFGIYEPLET